MSTSFLLVLDDEVRYLGVKESFLRRVLALLGHTALVVVEIEDVSEERVDDHTVVGLALRLGKVHSEDVFCFELVVFLEGEDEIAHHLQVHQL